jgi:Ca2+:H+ antiporter
MRQCSPSKQSRDRTPSSVSSDASSSKQLIMELDSIKSRARHASWRNDGESKWDRYNPFYRKQSRSRDITVDEENQKELRPQAREAHSTGCIDTTNNGESYPPPAHANTYQSGSPTSSTATPVDGHMNGASKDYYHGEDESQTTTLNNEVDGIAHSRKTATGLATLPEKNESTNGQGSSEYDDVDEEARKKREHDDMMKKKIPWGRQFRMVLFPQLLTVNWLLIMAPIGIGLNYAKVNPLAIFIVNFVAIVPLAGILSFATEEIALRVGEVLGGLLNASFG